MKTLILFSSLAIFATQSHAEANNTDLLKQLVEISSGSADAKGVDKVQNVFAEELKKMGFKTESKPAAPSKSGSLLVGTLAGTSKETITFVAHADTVFEKTSKFSGFKLSEDGKSASGPGVIDDKGGIVVLLSALKTFLKDHPKSKYTLRVVSSSAEELGSPDFKTDFKAISDDSILVLGFEPCLDNGNIVESRRGNRWYNLKVTGREAHAGRAHKEGINACVELAKKIDAISKLTDYKKDLTVSVGHIEGGKDKYNVVCGEASAKIDMRFSDVVNRDKAHAKIEKIVNKNSISAVSDHKFATATLEIEEESLPFSMNKESKKYIERLTPLIQRLENRKVVSEKSGGGADTNSFSRPGLPIVDGLGACGGKMHTEGEFIDLSTIETRAKALAEFLAGL